METRINPGLFVLLLFLFVAGKLNAGQCGTHLCCQIKNACDVCNGQKDKPQKLRLRWVGNGAGPSSITFASNSICVRATTLISDSNSNEVVLDAASCFGPGSKLPTNINFNVDGATTILHASCSQALNLGDVLYTDKSKGFLVLVGFQAMSGRTHRACSGARPQTRDECDACNGQTDKPQQLRFRWEGKEGAPPSSITFASSSVCVTETTLTSDSDSNEVVLDAASCFGPGSTLQSNVYFKVDGSATYLHTSCSQALNLGDVIYMDKNKGSLVLVGFQALSGRTDGACSGGPAPRQDQCTCNDAKQCFGDVLRQMRKKDYRLECEPAKPQLCEAVTRVNISPEECGTARSVQGCSHANGFNIVMCPCSEQCFDGQSCQSGKCPCNSVDCSTLSSPTRSLLDYIKKDECVCTGAKPCLTDLTRPKCDICNLRKDKPQTLIFRWVGKAGAQTSIRFHSEGSCVKETILTSGSNLNEVVLDASCFGSGSKLPTDIYFKVDGATTYLHASCSQPLNVGDVVYEHRSKGSLVLVGFRSVSGRTESACGKPTQTCGPRSLTAPSLSCGAGITLQKDTSTKGVALRINSDYSIQYMWSQARHGVSTVWTDEFEYTGTSCDGEKVTGKVIVSVRTPWVKTPHPTTTTATTAAPTVPHTTTTTTAAPTVFDTTTTTTTAAPSNVRTWGPVRPATQCDARAGEVLLKKSSIRVKNLDECKQSCENAAGCQSITYFEKNGWCAHFSTPCTKTKKGNKKIFVVQLVVTASNLDSNDGVFAEEIEHGVEQDTDSSILHGVCTGIWWMLMNIYFFNMLFQFGV